MSLFIFSKFSTKEIPLIQYLLNFLLSLRVKFHRSVSVLGLILLFTIIIQCLSGILLSFSLVSEPMLIPISRDIEDMNTLYTDDFFWLHERGVDYIFLLTIMHFFRKFFIFSFSKEQESAWKSGSFLFLIIHGAIFFGLVLCCTHLSDITLTIAANIINTFSIKIGKLYWVLFTDQTLNIDTILRSMYAHYIIGLYTVYLGILHSLEMHYDWKDFSYVDGVEFELNWFETVFKNELFKLLDFFLIFIFITLYLYSELEPLSFEVFMWGDVGLVTDVRFLGVAPHWYFRAYMSWLLLCPHHYVGIFGLIFLMISIYFQPNLKATIFEFLKKSKTNFQVVENNLIYCSLFTVFLLCALYTDSFLPYGRFFNKLFGNLALLISYLFLFVFLTFPLIKLIFFKQFWLSC